MGFSRKWRTKDNGDQRRKFELVVVDDSTVLA
jgi:hypothetical protein